MERIIATRTVDGSFALGGKVGEDCYRPTALALFTGRGGAELYTNITGTYPGFWNVGDGPLTRLDRFFHLTNAAETGVACDETGVFVGGAPLLEKAGAAGQWRPRSLSDLNRDLGECYGLPVDMDAKFAALGIVAQALNRGDLAHAQIVTLHLQLPDPPTPTSPDLAKAAQTQDDILDLAERLQSSGLLKADWEPAKHPRQPAGSPNAVGGQFAQSGNASGALAAVDFAFRHLHGVLAAPYSEFALSPEVGGHKGRFFHGFSAPKCNIFVYDAYNAVGAAPELTDGTMPLAEHWGNANVPISAKNGGAFKVVATGDLRQMDLDRLQPGDIVSNGHHVGIYAPVVYSDGENRLPGYSDHQVVRVGAESDLTPGSHMIVGRTISAAVHTPFFDFLSDGPPLSSKRPLGGGVTWNSWGFHDDPESNRFVVRRLIRP